MEVYKADENAYYMRDASGNERVMPKALVAAGNTTPMYESALQSYQAKNAPMPVQSPVGQYPLQSTVTPMPNVPTGEAPATAADYAAPAPQLQPAVPQMPMTMSTTTEAPSMSITQKQIAPEAKKALDDADRKLIEATTAKTNAELNAINVQAEGEKKMAEENVKLSQIAQQNEATRLARLKESQDDFNASVKELAGMKVDQGRIWKDKTTGDKIAVGIGVLLGAIGQGLTGGKSNYALDVIDNAIERDIAAQKTEIATKGEVLGQKQNAIAMMRQRFGDERLADLAFKEAAMEKVKASILDKMASTKSDAVRAQGQMALSQIAQGSAQRLAEATQISATKTAGGEKSTVVVETGKPEKAGAAPTEFQGKAAMFAAGAELAEKNFQDIEKQGFQRGSWSQAALKVLPEATRSALQKRQNQAELAFADAFLRQTSGAAISDSERKDAAARFFPRAGDSPEVLAQKEQDRKLQIQLMKQLSGPAGAQKKTSYTPVSFAGSK